MKKTYLLFALIAIAGAAAGFGLQLWLSAHKEDPLKYVVPGSIGLEIGDPRPEVTLPGLDGKEHALSEWNGKILVLNFWATWCQPCREEMPALMALQKDYGDKGLQVVGIAVDMDASVKKFVDELGVTYPILTGEMAAVDASHAYGNHLGVLPYTVLIDRDGFVRQLYPRQINRQILEPDLRPLL